ncbi:MAG: AmmeMemoRadiSam system radical SAM enzyme, partial [Holophagales bacterium]|nr:AmmeMemoRadiSam system radical SAM enzyme [Holophagales bacterium]
LGPVLETLEYLVHETPVWVELTTLLIPGENDSDEEITDMARWVVSTLGPDVPMHFTAFHPDYKMRHLPPTPAATLHRARAIALSEGVRHVYTGNIRDREGGATTCSTCGELLIERSGYELGVYSLDQRGRCLRCHRPLPGRFDGPAGNWGSRRRPVWLAELA